MDKHEIIKCLDEFLVGDVDCTDIIDELNIVYGAAMVLRDIKDSTDDIDVYCEDHAFYIIHERFGLPIEDYQGNENCKYMSAGNIDFFKGSKCSMKTVPICTRYRNTRYLVQTVLSLLAEKQARGRGKDLRDVELIHEFIKRKSQQ